MAAMRAREQLPVGSSKWIQDENAHVASFCGQELEDFTFSARNEVEWLNEHMAEIFSKDQLNVADVFKTPGKLRGKTPRTARKKNALEAREPLSDIFSANVQRNPTPAKGQTSRPASPPKVPAFKVAKDEDVRPTKARLDRANVDSGYHGLTEDEMDGDAGAAQSSNITHDTLEDFPHSPALHRTKAASNSLDRSTTEETSFHSAREDITKRDVTTNVQTVAESVAKAAKIADEIHQQAVNNQGTQSSAIEMTNADLSRPSSRESNTEKPLVRKSSLSFAALPAREPITTKKSIGARLSRTSNLDQSKAILQQRGFLERLTGGKSLGGIRYTEAEDDEAEDVVGNNVAHADKNESDTDSKIKLHNKSSTQRLHERINMLGKSQHPRPTKSIPSAAQLQHPDLHKTEHHREAVGRDADRSTADDDDDWIKPPPTAKPSQIRPQLMKSISADTLEHGQPKRADVRGSPRTIPQPGAGLSTWSKVRSTETVERTNAHRRPEVEANLQSDGFAVADGSHTPSGSPSNKRYVDGPLSASKTKLQSIMKTARGLFSSSAGISAQARMETLSPSMAHQDAQAQPAESIPQMRLADVEEVEYPQVNGASKIPRDQPVQKTQEQRLELKEAAERQQMEIEKGLVQQQEAAIRAKSSANELRKDTTTNERPPTRQSPRKTSAQEKPPLALSQGPGRTSPNSRPKEARRPVKPSVKDAVAKPKAPPVSIRIGMPSQRLPLTNVALSSTLQESLPPVQPKQPTVVKKASTASLHSSTSTTNLKKPKALIAAERKKEQDEREAQRKLDLKLERKKVAQQEEDRRQEERQKQENDRQRERAAAASADDAKKAAQKQAIEKRRLELQKKEQRPLNKSVTEHGGPHSRPPSRQHTAEPSRPPTTHGGINPSKAPVKRVFDPEGEHAPVRKPQGAPSYHQTESKRRKTEEDLAEEPSVRPTMAPPIRQSVVRKDGPKPSTFNTSTYTTAPPAAAHHAHSQSLLKSTTSNQAKQHVQGQHPRPPYHADTAKYRDGNKIPFAEHPNPPPNHHLQRPSQPHKTPMQTAKLNRRASRPNSPYYPNGENIVLADIPTDSEESESSPDTAQKRAKVASLPDWAQSPNLRQLLEQQEDQLDADAVFGPVASPHMEEMFKERHHRFRNRTSSANWAGSDRLTEEEIRRDVEARARLRREGGWTYGL